MKTFLPILPNRVVQKFYNKFLGLFLLLCAALYSSGQTTETFTTPGSGSFIVPAGVTSIYVECWGGGGAGATRSTNGAGGGGAGGAYAASTIAVTPGASINYFVGSGGESGTTGTNINGKDSWFNTSSSIMAKGGPGVANNGSTGATAPVATMSIGTVRYKGGNGRAANTIILSYGGGGGSSAGTSANGNNATNNNGAAAPAGGGAGGDGRYVSQGNGSDGDEPGGGGGGALRTSSGTRYGGNGGNGKIKVTYTKPTYKSQLIGTINYGSINWCAGETRNVTVEIKNVGTATWNDGGSAVINVGIKWNTNGVNWADYHVRVSAGRVEPNQSFIYLLPITASNHNGTSYTTPLATGTNKLTIDVVYEGVSWFGNNANGVGPGNVVFQTPNINIISLPTDVSAAGSPNPVCIGATLNLNGTATNGETWAWTGPNGFTSSDQNPTVSGFGPDNVGVYTLTASNACGTSAPVNTAAINFHDLPVVSAPSAVCMGSSANLIPSSGGTWVSNNPAVASVTNAGLVTGLSAGTSDFTYTESATGCSNTSSLVTVNNRPTASITSSSTSVCSNNSSVDISGEVIASGNWTLTLSDGSSTTGSGNGSFSISVSPTTTTTYTISSITDDLCASLPADLTGSVTITVNEEVQIADQPQPTQSVCSSFPVSFTVAATGYSLSYQWYFGNTPLTDNANVSGTQTPTLNINQVTVADAGAYHVLVTGAAPCAQVVSDDAILDVSQDIEITDQPESQIKCAGETAVFSVIATGSNLNYLWRKGNTPLFDGGNISGAATSSLTIANVSPADVASNYNVVISGDGICPQVISVNASLTINPIPSVSVSAPSQQICNEANIGTINFSGSVSGTTFNWVRDNPSVTGTISTSGSGNISGTLINSSYVPVTVTFTITPEANGCYGTPATASVLVKPSADVIPSLSSQTICSGNSITDVTFSSNVSGTGFSWVRDNPSVTGTISTSGSGIISGTLINPTANPVTVTFTITPLANGCTGISSQVTVLVNPLPAAIATPDNQNVCNNGSISNIVLSSATSGTSFSWTRDNTAGISSTVPMLGTTNISGSFTNSGTDPQTVTISITGTANGCSGNITTATVVVNPTAVASVNSSTQTICSQSNISTIIPSSTTSGATLNWVRDNLTVTGMPANGSGNISGSLNNPGNTQAIVNFTITPVINGCAGTPVMSSVLVDAKPTLSVSPASQFVCYGNALTNIVLTNPNNVAGTVISWTRDNPAGISTALPSSGNGNISGTITNTTGSMITVTFAITATAPNGCKTTGTASVTLYPELVPPTVTSSQVVCYLSAPSPISGTPATGGSGSYTYQWQYSSNGNAPWTNIGGATSLTYQPPTTSRYYQLVVKDGTCGTKVSNMVQVSLSNNFSANFESDDPPTNAFCPGASFNYNIVSGSLSGLFNPALGQVRFSWSADPTYVSGPSNPYGSTESLCVFFLCFYYFEGNATFTLHNPTNAPVTVPITITPSLYNSSGNVVCNLTPIIFNVTINPSPSVNSISNQTFCAGANTSALTFSGPVSGTNFTWTNSNTSIGLAGSGSGNLPAFTATNNGTAPISSTVTVTPKFTNGGTTCSGSTKNFTITVNPKPTVNAVSNVTVCNNATTSAINFGSNVSGVTYNWTNSNPSIGLAGSGTGNISSFTAQNPGTSPVTATIDVTATYTNNAVSCPGPVRSFTITVNPDVQAGSIGGTQSYCIGESATLTSNGTPGGTWSSGNNNIATVNSSTGMVSAIGSGTVNIFYTINSGCNSPKQTSYSITVNPNANPGTISGTSNMCIGSSATFTSNGDAGGSWSSSNNGVVSVNPSTGLVTAIGEGTANIIYTPGGCNATASTFPVTVDPDANAGTVSGAATLCPGSTSGFSSNGDGGGTWMSSQPSVASVDQLTGMVTAISQGTTVISYTVSSGCNAPVTATANLSVSANANAGTIIGTANMCTGTNAFFFTNGDGGGSWSSSNNAVATVNPTTGLVSTNSPGTCNIIYTVSTGCNSPATSVFGLTVNPVSPASPGVITGDMNVCASSSSFIYSISSVPNATNYIWTIPAGWSFDGGQGTASITVTSGESGGVISVAASNFCGTSPVKQINVSVIAAGTWTGTQDHEWHHTNNWCGGVPTSTTNVTIPAGTPHQPRIHVNAYANNLDVNAGASLDVDDDLKLYGSLTANNNINASGGSIELTGTSIQNLGPNLFINNAIKDLVINNSNTVNLNGKLDIYGALSFGNAGQILETNDNLTLKSTNSRTARVGNLTGKVVNGMVTVERYIPDHTKAWQFLAVPVTGSQTINEAWQDTATSANQNRYPGYGTMLTGHLPNALSQGFDVYTPTGPSIKIYNPVTNNYDGVTSTLTTPVANPKGYMVLVRGDRSVVTYNAPATETVLRAKGRLLQPVNAPATINVQAGKFESIGNPYASPVDFSQLNLTGGVQTDYFYVWDPRLTTTTGIGANSNYGLGGFQTFSWNGTGFDVTPGGGSYSGGNRNIESGQAFFVHAPSTSGTVSFSESAKVSNDHNVFRAASKPIPQLLTRLSAITANGPVLVDGARVQFNVAYSRMVDDGDALKLVNGNENLGIMCYGKKLAVERRPMVMDTDTIFLDLTQVRAQGYQFEFVPAGLGSQSLTAFLEDRYLRLRTVISLTDTTRINFNVVNIPGSYAPDRFIIVFRRSGTLVPETLISITAERNTNHQVDVRWNVENEALIRHYMLERSMDGTHFEGIVSSDVTAKMNGKYRGRDLNALSGDSWYRVKGVADDGTTYYSNVVRLSTETAQPEINVFPNPVVNGKINVDFVGLKAGKYHVMLIYPNGVKSLISEVQVSGKRQSQTLALPAGIATGIYQLQVTNDEKTSIVKTINIAN